MNTNASRAKFSENAVQTVSAPRLIVMCFERLARDLEEAAAAMERSSRAEAHELCCHAQDILTELLASVDTGAWEHAKSLTALYSWAFTSLVRANIDQDRALVLSVREVLEEVREAFSAVANGAPADLATGVR